VSGMSGNPQGPNIFSKVLKELYRGLFNP